MKGENMEEVKVVKCKDCIYAGEALNHGTPRMICNNRIVGYVKPDFYCAEGKEEEEEKYWVFTFGCGQELAGKAIKIFGTFNIARTKMIERYGDKWAFQYSEENWEKMRADRTRMYRMEEIMEVIE